MASPGEDQATTFSPEDEDIRGDGKKRKFKPLSAVRKLFSGRSKRKKESVVTVKAQSTTALHSGVVDDDEDDDGGFKAHQSNTPPSLAGNRSISEDSVFSPNTAISAFPTAAVSAESVPKSQLQSELLSKLSHRRSLYSDDDHDDGLPRSPVQPFTTADVIHGEYLKPVTSGKKSQYQGSEQSLISVGSSENEEDNLFTSKWKRFVPAKTSGPKSASKMSQGSVSEEPLDFSNIQKTELLKSTAAKDRISIKPQSRRASRLSRKKRETSQSLPSLNEESPLKVRIDSDIRNNKSNNNAPKEPEPKENTAISTPALDIQSTTASTPSVALLSSSAPSTGMFTSAVLSTDNNLDASKQEKVAPINDVKKEVEDQKENAVEEKPKSFPRSSIKARAAGFESSSVSSKPLETPKSEGASLKVSDPNSNVTMSPREDYKIKRQTRSKTIPAGNTEEEYATKVQRASSERVQTSTISVQSPAKEQESDKAKNESTQSSASGSVKKLDASKFSRQDSNSSSEPSWISMVRKKKEGQMAANDNEKAVDETSKSNNKPSDTFENTSAASNPKSSFSSVKSVFGSSNNQDKKWGSMSTGGADQGKDNKSTIDSAKKEENPKEITNTKRPSIDVGTVRRESLEINVSELNSVKAMTSSFSNSSKRDSITSRWTSATNDDTKTSVPSSSSPAPYLTSSTSERAKLFSGASAPTSTSTGPNSAKPPSSGISQSRFGSVKTSPTKSAEVKSVFSGRGGSVKTTTPSSKLSTSPASKSESVSSPSNPESQSSSNETKLVTTSANNVGSQSVSVSSSRPPPHPNSSSPSSQPSTKVVSPTSSSQSTSGFVKPVSFGVKTSPFSVAKPFASNPASASSISGSVASSKHSPTATTSSSTSSSSVTSSSSSQTKTSPIRSHSSFTSSSVNKPEVSTTPSSIYSRSTAISKSTSMKASPPVVSQQEKETTTAKVPAWRANLPKKDVKIEIIEKTNNFTPSSQSCSLSSSSQNKNENGKKIGDNSSRVAEMAKTTEMRTSLVTTPEKTSHRSSKVLDLVKNFQNLQVSS